MNMEAQELLEKLLNEIEQVKLVKDLKNDNSQHINNVIMYYSILKNEFPNSTYLKTASEAILSFAGMHPALEKLANVLLNPNKKQEKQVIKGEKIKGQPIVDNFIELLKAIKSTIAEHKAKEKASGMQDTFECEQYISLLRQYQTSLGKYKDRLNPKHLAEMHSLIESEIQHANDLIEYANSIDSGFTL